jgi:hypothetical protein
MFQLISALSDRSVTGTGFDALRASCLSTKDSCVQDMRDFRCCLIGLLEVVEQLCRQGRMVLISKRSSYILLSISVHMAPVLENY